MIGALLKQPAIFCSNLSHCTARHASTTVSLRSPRTLQEKNFDSARQQGGMVNWPVGKSNPLFNICQQGEMQVVERFGRLNRIVGPGLYLAIPFCEKIKRVDMREKAIPIEPQMAISRDNVSVRMSGVVYLRFFDPQKAAYGHYNPLFAVLQHAQSAMRAAIGELELDALFHDRAALNVKITNAISQATEQWGVQVLRYEVTEILPDETISEAMDRQAQAERIRREKVLQASGDKESQILRSEGDLQARTNEALAKKAELELHAQGRANAVATEAAAQAGALERVASALQCTSGEQAARLELAREYMRMIGAVGSQSNTIFFGERAGDIEPMLARVAAALVIGNNAASHSGNKVAASESSLCGKSAAK
jgi:regulator of protease activity HflC (stomatin/prohibitin superfamily)